MAANSNLTDEELVILSLQTSSYFGILVKRYENKLLTYIRRFMGTRHPEAEDILQNAFIKMYRNLNDFDKNLKFSSWAYRITHNEIVDYLRAHTRQQKFTINLDDAAWENIKSNIDPIKNIDTLLLRQKITAATNKLEEKYRDVLILFFLEEKTYEEIADILRRPVGTVGALISRGRKKLSTLLQNI